MQNYNALNSIKTRRTIRQYTNAKISNALLTKVLEGGQWTQSVHNQQPWRFVVIKKKDIKNKLGNILSNFSSNTFIGFNTVLKETARNIKKAPILIVVYNTCDFSRRTKNLGEPYTDLVKLFEVQSIAACIQNMCLVAHDLELGAAWLGAPLFCENEINKLLNEKYTLMGIISMGHFKKTTIAVPKRKELKDIVKII